MTRFNRKTETKLKVHGHQLTENLAGGTAYTESRELEIVSLMLTNFMNDQFYRKSMSQQQIAEIVEKFPGDDVKFVAQAALYARHVFGMRSVSHAFAAEIAKQVKGEEWTKQFFSDVVRRVDDATEVFAAYGAAYGRPFPNALRKGLALSLAKFDGYQLAKYRGEGHAVKLVDLVNLCHPKPSEKNAEILKQLMKDELRSTETWEAMISATAGDKEKKAVAWRDLLTPDENGKRKIGYFALLRNLRNIVSQAPDMIDEACAMLTTPYLIKKSLVMPFRFLKARENFGGPKASDYTWRGSYRRQMYTNRMPMNFSDQRVLVALNRAVEISCDNVPRYEGKTCILQDISGSMAGETAMIAGLFAAILYKTNNADLVQFDSEVFKVDVDRRMPVLDLGHMLANARGGTDMHKAFQCLERSYDRIILLSDMQTWMQPWSPCDVAYKQYCAHFNCKPHLYSWDLQGYGTIQFPEKKVYCLAGWSEKVFDLMKLVEQDPQALINAVKDFRVQVS